jgi:HD-GYP domain-containing protein (c-di-GMP phosphodiesterase class II)
MHSSHVATLVEGVARRLGLEDQELSDAVHAAELHGIGKVAIPFAVLNKPGPLDEQEWELMRRHPAIGANILGAAPALMRVAEIVGATHERHDGGGYPRGLAGEQIPLASRIVFVCDSFDAMTSERPYDRGRTEADAIEELRRCAGTQFDPRVVEAFIAEHLARHTAQLEASTPAPDPAPRASLTVSV